jgi:very-short-patch-repair endonuclease
MLNHVSQAEEPTPPAIEPVNFSGPWGTFRRLLGYYADCIRNDEGCEVSGFLQDYGERFIFLNQIGTWYPRIGQLWKLSLPSGPHLRSLLRKLTLAGEDGVLVLGYPFQIFTRPDGEDSEGVFVKPIFTYQLTWQLQANGLQIGSDDPWAEVNLDWLTYALKRPEQQRMFLSACGLMDRGQSDESFGDGSRLAYAPDLRTLAAGVTTFFGERIREPLLPEGVSSQPLPIRPASGIYNRAVLMIGNRTRYAKSLLRELSRIASCSDEELENSALRFIFKSRNHAQMQEESNEDQAGHDNTHESVVIDTCLLNGEQREAVAALLTENITVVTGPPGTGKSQVVAAAMMNARLQDTSVLFASRNHKALDAVVERLVMDEQPLIVRANSKEDSFLKFGFEHALTQLLSHEYSPDAEGKWEAIRSELTALLQRRGELGALVQKVQDLRDQLGSLEQHMASLAAAWLPEARCELTQAPALFPGKALTILERKLGDLREADETPKLVVRLGWWLKGLSHRVMTHALQRALQRNFPSWQLVSASKGFHRLRKLACNLPALLQAAEFCTLQLKVEPLEDELKDLPPLEELVTQISELSVRLAVRAPQALALHLERWTGLPREANREELASLRSALRGLDQPISAQADRDVVQAALEKSLPLLLQHFPLWAVTNLAVGPRFPLLPGLFKLAIIDEASQCDIPSAIPILFRAKRVGVVGDPHQLSHATKLSRTRDALLRKRHGLVQLSEQRFAYPDTSLYDLFAQTNNVNPLFLKETYRSTESIADYSNQLFYGGRLRVVTMAQHLRIPKGIQAGIHWTEVVSSIKSGGPSGCVAPEEVEAVIRLVRDILVENQFEGTLGIVTPFRQQANRINDRIYQEIPVEARRSSHLIVDTAHGFQGDERDVMVMSLCAGPDMPPGSRGFLRETANLMNVAVSRARAVLHVVGNRSWAARSAMPHLERLAAPSQRPSQPENPFRSPWYPHESPWEKILFEALKAKGVDSEAQYPVLGRRLDLALIRQGEPSLKIDIEVDGDQFHRNPDGTRRRDDVWRDIQLQGAGWRVMRFWVYQLRDDLDGCVEKILKVWGASP